MNPDKQIILKGKDAQRFYERMNYNEKNPLHKGIIDAMKMNAKKLKDIFQF